MTDNSPVDAYLEQLDDRQRATLEQLRTRLRSLLPLAEEELKYGMPAFTLNGKGVAGYAAFKDHCGYFPMSGSVLEQAGDAVAAYRVSKGGLQFDIGTQLPVGLLRRLIKLRLAELGQVTSGRRYEYFDDGRVKAVGGMKDGRLHGNWTWYRRDGSVLRTGQFRAGDEVGTWTTYAADGTPARTTRR